MAMQQINTTINHCCGSETLTREQQMPCKTIPLVRTKQRSRERYNLSKSNPTTALPDYFSSCCCVQLQQYRKGHIFCKQLERQTVVLENTLHNTWLRPPRDEGQEQLTKQEHPKAIETMYSSKINIIISASKNN